MYIILEQHISSTQNIFGSLGAFKVVTWVSEETDHFLTPVKLGSVVTSGIYVIFGTWDIIMGFSKFLQVRFQTIEKVILFVHYFKKILK